MSTPGNQVLTKHLDRTSDRAVFQQIADHLREAISSGQLAPGDALPSETQLADHYQVTRPTARHALDVLKTEGLVVAEHGRGSYVRQRPTIRRLASDRFARLRREQGKAAFLAEAEDAGAKPSVDQLVVTDVVPPEAVARKLKLSSNERVISRSRRYLISGQPVQFATSYIPSDIAQGTTITENNPGPGGIYGRIEEAGHRLDHFEEEIQARIPNQEEARRLAMPPGVPVFHLVRTAFDTAGRPVEVCDTVMSSDVYVLDYRLPAE